MNGSKKLGSYVVQISIARHGRPWRSIYLPSSTFSFLEFDHKFSVETVHHWTPLLEELQSNGGS